MTSLLALALTCTFPLASTAADLTPSPPSATTANTSSWEDALAGESMTSPWLTQVCKLLEAGTDQSIVLAYIDSAGSFSLNWKQIVRLRELGVPNEIVAAMLSHDTQLSAGLLPPPGPPPGPVMPRKLILTNFLNTASVQLRPTPVESIVNPSPAPELVGYQEQAEDVDILELTFNDLFPGVLSLGPVRPVREPYPVPLTDIIRIYRGASRTPNFMTLEWFP